MGSLRFLKFVIVLAALLLTPRAGFAQASITGVVKDTSGAVLPGVTVEVSSPVLIEKVRSAVTDGSGQYRFEQLRPGTYAVTMTLTGFSTVKREGIELIGSFTASVNGEMRVGSLQETITVSGEAPVVDVQSATRERVIGSDIVDAIPTGRTHLTAGVLIPGMNTSNLDVGGTATITLGTLAIHGGRGTDQRVTLEGLNTANADGSGQTGASLPNQTSIQEFTLDYAGGSAEQATGGVTINLIPKEGGNVFKGSVFATHVTSGFQGSNYTDDLKRRGLGTPTSIKTDYDYNLGFGGPILKDKLWIYVAARWNSHVNYVGDVFYDKNSGNLNAWTYDPDRTRPAYFDAVQRSFNGRLTWQANAKNKLSFFYDDQYRCWCPWVTTTVTPDAASNLEWPLQRNGSISWSSPVTSKLLVEAGWLNRGEGFQYQAPAFDSPLLNLIPVVEQSTGLLYRGGGLQTASQPYQHNTSLITNLRASVAYVTGSHSFKVGFGDRFAERIGKLLDNNYHMTYRFNGGVPNQLTERATPFPRDEGIGSDIGIYAQDKWTLNRLTVSYGVRFDYFNVFYGEQHLGPVPLAPTRDFTFAEIPDWVQWKDLTPRFGAAYDVFGNGKTALKMSLNKYMVAFGLQGPFGDASNPVSRMANFVTRSWNDSTFPVGDPRRQNFSPDCDLINPLANEECGTMSDVNFGKPTLSTLVDEDTRKGWGKRGYNWEFSAGIQQELIPRVSADIGYFRRWYGNFIVTDNLAVAPTDYSTYSITAPQDARLPGGGGEVISGLYDLNPNRVGQVNNLLTFVSNYGNQIEHWNGIDLGINARLQRGILLQGGISSGRSLTNNCDVVAKVDNPSSRFCRVETAFLTQVKFLGSYTWPKVDMQFSGTFQSIPGPQVLATYNAPNAIIAPSLGRNLSGGAANASVALVEPGTMYGERLNQLDLRVAKILRYRKTRVALNLDIYNALNRSTVLTQNNTYGAVWQAPQSIILARFAKISVQLDF